jgi:hypothetical protein
MYHSKPTSYEEEIDNAQMSFVPEKELEKILFDAVDNQRFYDWQFAIKECYLLLKSLKK